MEITLIIILFLTVVASYVAMFLLSKRSDENTKQLLEAIKETYLNERKAEREESKRYQEHEATDPDEIKELSPEEAYALRLVEQFGGLKSNETSGDEVDGN